MLAKACIKAKPKQLDFIDFYNEILTAFVQLQGTTKEKRKDNGVVCG